MAQIVQLKRSALSGKVPGTGSLNLGELAINTYDGKIYFRRSGSTDTVQEVITTNVVNTGSIFLSGAITASIAATNGVVSGSSQIIGVLSSLNRYTASVSTASLATTGSNTFVGAQTFNNDITVLGAVNARQFNINVISSSVIYQSGSTKFGDTSDDIMQVTGSVQITGSLYLNGTALGGTSTSTAASGTFVFPENFDYTVYDTGSFLDFNTQSLAYTLNFNTATSTGSPIQFIGALSHIDDKTKIYPTATSIDTIVSDVYVGSVSTQSFYTNLPITASGLNISGSSIITGSIRISSGSITMPNRPAFRVVGNASTERVAPLTLSGSIVTVDYNEGNYFSTTNGKFTAPIAGLYQVYYNGRVGGTNSMMQVIIYKNSNISSLMWETAGNTGGSHFGVNTILKLAINDTLEAKVMVGSIQFDANDSWGVAYIG